MWKWLTKLWAKQDDKVDTGGIGQTVAGVQGIVIPPYKPARRLAIKKNITNAVPFSSSPSSTPQPDNSSDFLTGVLVAETFLLSQQTDNPDVSPSTGFGGFGGGESGGGGVSGSWDTLSDTSSPDTSSSCDSSSSYDSSSSCDSGSGDSSSSFDSGSSFDSSSSSSSDF